MRLPLSCLLVPLALAGAGCDPESCPAIDCVDTIRLDFVGKAGALPPSTYEIVLEVRSETFLVVCGQPDGTAWQCEDPENQPAHALYTEVQSATDAAFTIWIEGGFSPDDLTRIGVSVLAGDAPLLDETMEFDFRSDDNSDGECATCRGQTREIAL
jgi:hypothetical protein